MYGSIFEDIFKDNKVIFCNIFKQCNFIIRYSPMDNNYKGFIFIT